MKRNKHHLAIRWNEITLCGREVNGDFSINNTYWADAYNRVKSDPDNKGMKFCQTCVRIKNKKKIKQLTAEECKKA